MTICPSADTPDIVSALLNTISSCLRCPQQKVDVQQTTIPPAILEFLDTWHKAGTQDASSSVAHPQGSTGLLAWPAATGTVNEPWKTLTLMSPSDSSGTDDAIPLDSDIPNYRTRAHISIPWSSDASDGEEDSGD
jgi:hypothetical protein